MTGEVLIGLFFVTLMETAFGHSTSDNERVKYMIEYTIDVVDKGGMVVGDAELKALMDKVVVELSYGVIPNAYAYRSMDGVPHVVIERELIYLLYYSSELSILNLQSGGELSGCQNEYMSYISLQYSYIARALLKGEAAEFILAPEDYADNSMSCHAVKKMYPLSGAFKEVRDRSVVNGLAFIYLHELGHLRFGHSATVSQPMASLPRKEFLDLMCKARSLEDQADGFAVDTLVDIGYHNAVLEVPLWIMLTAVSGIDPGSELEADHANGSSRFEKAATRMRSRLAVVGIAVPPMTSDLIDQLSKLIKKIDEQLSVPPMEEGADFACKQNT
jgi:hypothetical protein